MVLIDSSLPFEHLVAERFHYSPLSGEWTGWAVVRLLAGLGARSAAPSGAHLVIETEAGGRFCAAADAHGTERRLRTGGAAGFDMLWSATFSVPLESIEAAPAVFTLLAGERDPVAVTLPAPVRDDLPSPILSLRERRPPRPRTIRPRQIAAVATSVAVTATSAPTVALATQVTTRTATRPAATPARAASGTTAGAPHCTTTDTQGPVAYAATGGHPTCPVRPRPSAPAVGGSMSFGKSSSSTSKTAARGTHHATPTGHHATPTGHHATPTGHHATPVTHHAAPAARRVAHHPAHHVSHRPPAPSSGGAPLAPSTPRTTSTSAPAPPPAPSSTSTPTVTTLAHNPPGFTGPSSWTGSVAANPALTGAVTELSGLLSNGNRPPSFLIPIYMEAGRRYRVPWEVLAAINAIESDYGRNLNTSSAGAVGWMQFEPSTWAQYGMAVDGHSVPNPYDPRDAIFSAARYLAAAGAARDVSRAVFAYNHASWYVDEVMSRARAIATHAQFERAGLEHGKFSVYFAGGGKPAARIRYTSGVLSHYDRLIAAANMVSAADFPYVWGGGHTQPARFGPFDCSGSVSYVMQQAGYNLPTSVSGDIGSWKFPAGPGAVTIFYNPTHTFMRIGDRYFGTSGFARPGGGAGWFDVNKLPASYLAQFSEVHVPDLGPDSFDGAQPPVAITPLVTRHGHRATSTLSFFPLMSTLGPFPGTATLPTLPT